MVWRVASQAGEMFCTQSHDSGFKLRLECFEMKSLGIFTRVFHFVKNTSTSQVFGQKMRALESTVLVLQMKLSPVCGHVVGPSVSQIEILLTEHEPPFEILR